MSEVNLNPIWQLWQDLGWCSCGRPEETLTFLRDVLRLLDNSQLGLARYDTLRKMLGAESHPGLCWSYFYMLDSAGLTEHGTSISSGGWLTGYGKRILAELERADLDTFDPGDPNTPIAAEPWPDVIGEIGPTM